MKIAYILYPEAVISNKSNGIKSQAETWAKVLIQQGHEVDLINHWSDYYWATYDVIHFWGSGKWVYGLVRRMRLLNSNIVWSPIVDPRSNFSFFNFHLKNVLHKCTNGLLLSKYMAERKTYRLFQKIITRSAFETAFIAKVYRVPQTKISFIPLSYSLSSSKYDTVHRENFCLHISSIWQPRKNVIRLIQAAKKYHFKLVLAGDKGTAKQFEKIDKAIGDSDLIEVLGYVSSEEKDL